MNTGVGTSPRRVCSTPARARPSIRSSVNRNVLNARPAPCPSSDGDASPPLPTPRPSGSTGFAIARESIQVLSALGSGQMPALADLLPPEPTSDPDVLLERFLAWVQTTGLTLYPAQEEALLELMAGKHVLLATPTGSGKSLV